MCQTQLGVCGLRQLDVVLMIHYLACILPQLVQVAAREAKMSCSLRGNFLVASGTRQALFLQEYF